MTEAAAADAVRPGGDHPGGSPRLMRCFVVRRLDDSARQAELIRAAEALGVQDVTSIDVADLWFVGAGFDPAPLIDPAIESGVFENEQQRDGAPAGAWVVETALLAGVTDPVGEALARAAELAGAPLAAHASGRRFVVHGPTDSTSVAVLARRLLANAVIERHAFGAIRIAADRGSTAGAGSAERVPVSDLDDEGLVKLSTARGLALDLDQMSAVRTWFTSAHREPTDAELETIAQTWSEHCAHTTFRADITWTDGTKVTPLLRQLRDCTDALIATEAVPFVRSAFVGNAGIVAFDGVVDIAVKAETHNHPSAIEPFGGANTGVGGVIRDVLGVSAFPIAVTDVLCFGPADTSPESLPDGVLHPRRIRDGVVAGVADYGNKIGLPTVAGAIVHDPGYTANPLVFAGCVGVRAVGREVSGAQPGHRIVAIGGRTGRDGIRGATFSSMTMDATTGDVAGASVQIGDPITERGLINLIHEAFGQNLYSAITDCGAGGFSSAIGEMAEILGADVELARAPRKYAGLAPWEVWLSEAQERMVVGVDPDSMATFTALAEAHGVEWADLGAFRADGRLVVQHDGEVIIDLPTDFLHNGRPQRHLRAAEPQVRRPDTAVRTVLDPTAALFRLLAHPSLRSNEDVVRTYDHEILGATVGRPYAGASDDGPADAAVLIPVGSTGTTGLAIGLGVNARYGDLDARALAEMVVDEAIRNVVAAGADPDRICLLDNFSWGDPRRDTTLGQLVRAVEGCVAASTAHRAPFVSGKDSLNNEYITSDGTRRAVPPTLVITAFGAVPDVDHRIPHDLQAPGNLLIAVGATNDELRGSHLDAVLGIDGPGEVPHPSPVAPARFRSLHGAMRDGLIVSCHDVSEGGIAVALAEVAMAGRLGIEADVSTLHADPVAALFSETGSRFVIEVRPADVPEVLRRFSAGEASEIGVVVDSPAVAIQHGTTQIYASLPQLLQAWRGHV